MKVSFLSDKLQEKLAYLNHAVSTRGQLPILSCFLLKAKDGKLTISATDLEIGITSFIDASIEVEGEAVIPAKNFTDLLLNMGSTKISLSLEGETLGLKGENVKASFQTMQKEDFPVLFEDDGHDYVRLKKEEIEKYFSRVVFAAASSETSRPALSGILIDKDKSETVLVATDSYRLSLQKTTLKTSQELEKPIVVPARVIKELMSLKESKEIKIKVSKENNQVLFIGSDTVLIGRLIEAEYPEYQKIIPSEFTTKSEIGREDLLKAIKIASVFARDTANMIKLIIGRTKIIVSANSPTAGEDSVEVEAKTTGEENDIVFNAKYLLDALSVLSEEELIFQMNGPLNPGVFKLKNDNSFLHLVMPIRAQG